MLSRDGRAGSTRVTPTSESTYSKSYGNSRPGRQRTCLRPTSSQLSQPPRRDRRDMQPGHPVQPTKFARYYCRPICTIPGHPGHTYGQYRLEPPREGPHRPTCAVMGSPVICGPESSSKSWSHVDCVSTQTAQALFQTQNRYRQCKGQDANATTQPHLQGYPSVLGLKVCHNPITGFMQNSCTRPSICATITPVLFPPSPQPSILRQLKQWLLHHRCNTRRRLLGSKTALCTSVLVFRQPLAPQQRQQRQSQQQQWRLRRPHQTIQSWKSEFKPGSTRCHQSDAQPRRAGLLARSHRHRRYRFPRAYAHLASHMQKSAQVGIEAYATLLPTSTSLATQPKYEVATKTLPGFWSMEGEHGRMHAKTKQFLKWSTRSHELETPETPTYRKTTALLSQSRPKSRDGPSNVDLQNWRRWPTCVGSCQWSNASAQHRRRHRTGPRPRSRPTLKLVNCTPQPPTEEHHSLLKRTRRHRQLSRRQVHHRHLLVECPSRHRQGQSRHTYRTRPRMVALATHQMPPAQPRCQPQVDPLSFRKCPLSATTPWAVPSQDPLARDPIETSATQVPLSQLPRIQYAAPARPVTSPPNPVGDYPGWLQAPQPANVTTAEWGGGGESSPESRVPLRDYQSWWNQPFENYSSNSDISRSWSHQAIPLPNTAEPQSQGPSLRRERSRPRYQNPDENPNVIDQSGTPTANRVVSRTQFTFEMERAPHDTKAHAANTVLLVLLLLSRRYALVARMLCRV